MFRLDYLSCLLTVVSTVLVARKFWIGLVLAGINSVIVCVIGFRTGQFGFIPANLFCIIIYAMNVRSWARKRTLEPEYAPAATPVATASLPSAPTHRLKSGIHLVYRAQLQSKADGGLVGRVEQTAPPMGPTVVSQLRSGRSD